MHCGGVRNIVFGTKNGLTKSPVVFMDGKVKFRVTDEYRAYLKGLQDNSNLSFKLESAQRFKELERLIEDRFIIVSDKYRRWVNDHSQEHCTLSTG